MHGAELFQQATRLPAHASICHTLVRHLARHHSCVVTMAVEGVQITHLHSSLPCVELVGQAHCSARDGRPPRQPRRNRPSARRAGRCAAPAQAQMGQERSSEVNKHVHAAGTVRRVPRSAEGSIAAFPPALKASALCWRREQQCLRASIGASVAFFELLFRGGDGREGELGLPQPARRSAAASGAAVAAGVRSECHRAGERARDCRCSNSGACNALGKVADAQLLPPCPRSGTITPWNWRAD